MGRAITWPSRFSLSMAKKKKQPLYPVVIIGSGPSGLSAAVYAGRGKAKTLVLLGNTPGGLLTETSMVENWPAIPSMLGREIMQQLQGQAARFGVEFWEDGAESIDLSSWPYKIITQEGKEIYAFTIILAMGASPRKLQIPGENEYWGKGVTTCAVCDAPFYKEKEVVVIGGGDSAVEEAIQLAQYASKITILVRKEKMRAAPTMQELLKGYPQISVRYNLEPREIKGNNSHVTAIELYNSGTKQVTEMPINGVFLAIGHIPNTRLVKGKVTLDDQGYCVITDRTQRTNIPGVYAAGDLEDHRYRQAGVAAGHGIAAGLDALAFLSEIGFNTEVATTMGLALQPVAESHVAHTVAELQKVLDSVDVAVVNFSAGERGSSLAADITSGHDNAFSVVNVPLDKSPDIAKKYFVFDTPAVLVFKKGTLVGRFNGVVDRKQLGILVSDLEHNERRPA